MSTPLPCPECERLDAVRKISSLYEQDVKAYTTYSVEQNEAENKIIINNVEHKMAGQAPLHELFKPPVKIQTSGTVLEVFLFQLITALLIVAIIVMAIFAFFFNQWLLYIIIAVVLLGGDMIAWQFLYKYNFRAKVEQAEKEIDERWQQARPDQRWENIYFCERCYGVYLNDPEIHLPLLPPELVHILYWWPDIDLETIRQTAISDGPEAAVYDYIEQTYTPPSIAKSAMVQLAKRDYQLEEVSSD